jgi:hypothetical protein
MDLLAMFLDTLETYYDLFVEDEDTGDRSIDFDADEPGPGTSAAG